MRASGVARVSGRASRFTGTHRLALSSIACSHAGFCGAGDAILDLRQLRFQRSDGTGTNRRGRGGRNLHSSWNKGRMGRQTRKPRDLSAAGKLRTTIPHGSPQAAPPANSRKFFSSFIPSLVSTLSGWNCTPWIGNSRWRNPMISPSAVRALTSRQSGTLSGRTSSE